eukprot:1138084-Pelagomonas_calceolata.AAC.1
MSRQLADAIAARPAPPPPSKQLWKGRQGEGGGPGSSAMRRFGSLFSYTEERPSDAKRASLGHPVSLPSDTGFRGRGRGRPQPVPGQSPPGTTCPGAAWPPPGHCPATVAQHASEGNDMG